ncbi:MAG TPA: hypothetical protein VG013_27270 [Gemmataceae bacterium]|jgi:hypothetical protein|nr:hypothetical protein [Gemmataceae bacterium]
MTEVQWLTCTDPMPMLEFLRDKTSDRKLRLFACACCRRILRFIRHSQSREALDFAERFADGLARKKELTATRLALTQALELRTKLSQTVASTVYSTLHDNAQGAAEETVEVTMSVGLTRKERQVKKPASFHEAAALSARELKALIEATLGRNRKAQCVLLRDIVGNPFRPLAEEPAWRTAKVVALAQAIYERRAFARMPALADALERAGCADATMLAHCRGRGPHARGCWLLDAILERG